MNVTVTVSIGRNIGTEPMSASDWANFQLATRGWLVVTRSTIYVDGAPSVGQWEGIAEESCTWVAELSDADVFLPILRTGLGMTAANYGQEAIALTVGKTEFATP